MTTRTHAMSIADWRRDSETLPITRIEVVVELNLDEWLSGASPDAWESDVRYVTGAVSTQTLRAIRAAVAETGPGVTLTITETGVEETA